MDNEKERINGLITRIKSDDKSAFDEFYKLTSPKAYFIALKITQNEHDAEDILQESYMKALEKLDEIDVSQNVMSWFCRIVANKSKNLVKSKKPLVYEGEDDNFFEDIPEDKTEFCPEENLNQEELRLEVMAAIDELTYEKRACIMMMYFGEMSVKEIAESIEVPESTVKNRLYTARKDLKNRFEKSGNVLYGAALGGVLIWALQKTSVTAAAAFAASAASANILAGIGASAAYSAATTASATAAATATTATAATSTAATTTAATATGIGAKAAALSVAQKVAVGIAATAVVGGGTAGVVTVVKNNNQAETTAYVEESTTAPTQKAEEIINRITAPAETPTEPSTEFSFNITLPSRKPYTTKPKTTVHSTTAKHTTVPPTSTTVTETATEIIKTTVPETTVVTTTQPQTTQPTTLAQATLIIEVTDFDDNVVDTLHLNVETGTEMTWDYLITLVSQNGYEAMAGIYGDGVGAVAQAGETYTFTAEL